MCTLLCFTAPLLLVIAPPTLFSCGNADAAATSRRGTLVLYTLNEKERSPNGFEHWNCFYDDARGLTCRKTGFLMKQYYVPTGSPVSISFRSEPGLRTSMIHGRPSRTGTGTGTAASVASLRMGTTDLNDPCRVMPKEFSFVNQQHPRSDRP